MKKNARKMHFDSIGGGGGRVGVYLEAEEKRWNE